MTSPMIMVVILAVQLSTTKYAYIHKVQMIALKLHVEMGISLHLFAIRAIRVDKELVLKLMVLNMIQLFVFFAPGWTAGGFSAMSCYSTSEL